MTFSYDIDLVVMSVVVAIMAAYAALDLAGRISYAEGRIAAIWLAGGAFALGAGIWSMHFIGMLAVEMPIQLGYDPLLTILSLLIAIATSGLALLLVSRKVLRNHVLVAGALIVGAGISCMHYTGMAAMKMAPPVRYDPLLFGASLIVAVAASLVGLWLGFNLRSESTGNIVPRKLLAAGIIGIGISGMHYTGMAAALFDPRSICTASVRLNADSGFLGHSIGATILIILSLTLLSSVFDARLQTRTVRMLADLRREVAEKAKARELLLESEQKYRALLDTTTDAVILLDEGNIVRFANPAIARVFGYSPEQVVGNDIAMLQPKHLQQRHRDAFRHYLDSGVKTRDWNAIEVPGRRSDGRDFPLEIAFSEVMLDGQRLFAAFMRDISERKEREARIFRLNRVRAVLSGISGLGVRARDRQELFEGACRVAVEEGKFLMAMIGVVAGDRVQPLAVYGVDDGYVEQNIHMSVSGADVEGRGPTATALREKRIRVCNDIAADPDMAPWRDAALQRGYRSSVALPLLEDGGLAGCICLYAAEPGFFDEEELNLLSGLARDISHSLDFIARDEQLDYLAYYDPLTRLANGKLFAQRLEHFLYLARQERKSVALLCLDLSQFKAINDALGHAGGDNILKQMADRMVSFTGEPGRVARLAGDRFVVVIPDFKAAGTGSMPGPLEQLWESLGRPVRSAEQEMRVAFRTGIAVFPEDADDADSLLRNAEAALKMAKAGSENHLFYTREMSAVIGEKLSLAGKLRQAFEREEFVLHYQPKVALDSGAICGVEALIRWASPEFGLVPPNRFIPLLEETGLILDVGLWALKQAAADYRDWLSSGVRAPRIAVNLSPVQLRRPDFVDTIRSVIGPAAGVVPGVDLEITESVLMRNIEQHIPKLKMVRDMGVSIAIDDFGTGYSSLAYLNKLPVSTVKIDRSFIVQMADSADTMSIVSTIISLAHSMKLKVVAEGVDSNEQVRFLRLLRCDEMQGFLFSKGLPARELVELLQEDRRLA